MPKRLHPTTDQDLELQASPKKQELDTTAIDALFNIALVSAEEPAHQEEPKPTERKMALEEVIRGLYNIIKKGNRTQLLRSLGKLSAPERLQAIHAPLGEFNDPALNVAAAWGCFELIKLLHGEKADINAKNMYASTALHIAAINDKPEQLNIIKFLLENNAEIDQPNFDGQTPLHLAALHGNTDAAQLLLQLGANPKLTDKQGQTPLDLARKTNKADLIKLIDEWKPKLQVVIPSTPNIDPLNLFELVQAGNIQGLRDKLYPLPRQERINAVNEARYEGHHLLTYTAKCFSIFDLLLKSGAVASDCIIDGKNTLLQLFCTHGNFKHLQAIFECASLENPIADINKTTEYESHTPFHLAMRNTHYSCMKLLLRIDPNTVNSRCAKTGETPLHDAAFDGTLEMVQFLIDSKADVNALDKNGISPLYIALMHRRRFVVLALLAAGANIHDIGKGQHARLIALDNSDYELLDIFPNEIDPNEPALCTMVRMGNVEGIRDALKAMDKSDKAKLITQTRNKDGLTLMGIAVLYKQTKVVEYLLRAGININATVHRNGDTALHMAYAIKANEIIDILTDNFALESTLVNKKGLTAQQMAASNSKSPVNLLPVAPMLAFSGSASAISTSASSTSPSLSIVIEPPVLKNP